MANRVLKSSADLMAWLGTLSAMSFPMTVSVTEGAKRTNPQNSTFHMWCSQIGKQMHIESGLVKGSYKRRFGLPIMIDENAAWVEKWEPLYAPVLNSNMDAEAKDSLFECLPMTSIFAKPQMIDFMEKVQRSATQNGLRISIPDDLKYEGAMR